MWVGVAVFPVAGGAWLAARASETASDWEQIGRAVGGGLIGLLVAVTVIFLFNLACAPYRQRNEARLRVSELEVDKAERLGRSEKQLRLILHTQKAREFLAQCHYGIVPHQPELKAWADAVSADLANHFGGVYWNSFSLKSTWLTTTDQDLLRSKFPELVDLLDSWIHELGK